MMNHEYGIDFDALIAEININDNTSVSQELERLMACEIELLAHRDAGTMPHNVADEMLRVCRAEIIDLTAIAA